MVDLQDFDLMGLVLKMKADNQGEDDIKQKAQTKGFNTQPLENIFDAIDDDAFFVVNTLFYKTFINPVTYTIGARRITVHKKIWGGIIKKSDEVGIRTIDRINIEEDLISATVIIIHSDHSEVRIEGISKTDARAIQKFFGYVIEAQRMKVINIASD